MKSLTWNWDWLLTRKDKDMIAYAEQQARIEQRKTCEFLQRLQDIERHEDTIIKAIERLFDADQ